MKRRLQGDYDRVLARDEKEACAPPREHHARINITLMEIGLMEIGLMEIELQSAAPRHRARQAVSRAPGRRFVAHVLLSQLYLGRAAVSLSGR